MASSNAYDEKLLSQAPEITRADLQDGYNADLLRETAVKRTNSTRAQSTPPTRSNSEAQQPYHQHDKDVESSAATPLRPKEDAVYSAPRKPWWKTVKGILIIVVVLVVIILVAVLGGVLGSRKSNNKSGSQNNQNQPVASDGQGVGNATTTTRAPSPAQSSGASQGNGQGASGGTGQGQTTQGAGGTLNGTATESGGAQAPSPGGAEPPSSGGTVARRKDEIAVELLLRDLGVEI